MKNTKETAWNLNELRDNVERQHGRAQKDKLCPSLNSLDERQFHAIYHYQEHEKILNSIAKSTNTTSNHLRLIIGNASNNEDSQMAIFKINAHLIACILAMHSISDILSHAIYYSLNMEINQKVSIYEVIKSKDTPDTVREKLLCLTEHSDYKYLCALANHSKHHNLIHAGPSVNLVESRSGIKFSKFIHKNVYYFAHWADDFLGAEYSRQNDLVISIGKDLNFLTKE